MQETATEVASVAAKSAFADCLPECRVGFYPTSSPVRWEGLVG